MNTPDTKHEDKFDLLSDDDFVALMDAEYQSTQKSDEYLQKQPVWNEIEKNTRNKNSVNSRSWIPLAAAALFALTLFPLLKVSQLPDESMRIKGRSDMPAIHLSAYKLLPEGELTPVSHSIKVGETIVFKLGATRQAVTGLSLAVNKSAPLVRFVSDQFPAGMEQLLQRDERSYGYVVEAGDQQLDFCAIGANTVDELQAVLNSLPEILNTLQREACVTLFVNS